MSVQSPSSDLSEDLLSHESVQRAQALAAADIAADDQLSTEQARQAREELDPIGDDSGNQSAVIAAVRRLNIERVYADDWDDEPVRAHGEMAADWVDESKGQSVDALGWLREQVPGLSISALASDAAVRASAEHYRQLAEAAGVILDEEQTYAALSGLRRSARS